MPNIYDCALVYSPHLWVEKFHRHCTNTGQLKIRSFIYDSTVLFSDEYDVVIVSDSWPALSRALVEKIQKRNAKVIGLCEANDDSREFLSSVGVDGIIDSTNDAKSICDEIIKLLDTLKVSEKVLIDNESYRDILVDGPTDNCSSRKCSNISTVIGTGGTGCTELGIVLASRLIDSLMIDMDFEHPSLAPRTNLDIEPHIIDAIETAQNNKENFLACIKQTNKFSAIVGLTHASLATDIRDYEMQVLLDEARVHFSNIILDCGSISQHSSFYYLYETIFSESNSFIIIGDCSPHGIIRILETLVIVVDFINTKDTDNSNNIIEIIINKTIQDKNLQRQIEDEIKFCSNKVNITFIAENQEIHKSVWLGNINYPKKWLNSFNDILYRLNEVSKSSNLLNENELADLMDNQKITVVDS